MKNSIYILVFAIIVVLIIFAALSTTLFNKKLVTSTVSLANLSNDGPAPNFQGGSAWINSPPLNISSLKGKVVLVDFWTYSCINCIRSIPHLNAWYSEYGNNGLVIIGVHTPEFQFEHNYSNVYNAVQRFGIKYPVVLDNNYTIWDAYHNEYWPADYLIDANGTIRYVVFGEGNYNQTELVIRALLKNAGYVVPTNLTNVSLGVNFSGIRSPELYFGYVNAGEHQETIGNSQGFSPNQTVDYNFSTLTPNEAYLSGEWYNAPDGMIAVNNSKIFLIYYAKDVNVVASGNNTTVTVKLNGTNLSSDYLGSNVKLIGNNATAIISSPQLYNLVDAPSYGEHVLEIDAKPGFKIYTFTFG
jgi:thiol-disulfide isomerase/thioredoxin